jgi:restriction endonuclease BglII
VGLEIIPEGIRKRYHIEERRHACALLAVDYSKELSDILDCLAAFELLRSEIQTPGGGKSKIAGRFDKFFGDRDWKERSIKVSRTVEEKTVDVETHKVDFCKGSVAVEVEWNNKDPFFSRDLNAFRLLHELGVIAVGVIITRMDELQDIFAALPDVWDEKNKKNQKIGDKYGASTTHWGKLVPRVQAGGHGTCPLLLIGISKACYRDDLSA